MSVKRAFHALSKFLISQSCPLREYRLNLSWYFSFHFFIHFHHFPSVSVSDSIPTDLHPVFQMACLPIRATTFLALHFFPTYVILFLSFHSFQTRTPSHGSSFILAKSPPTSPDVGSRFHGLDLHSYYQYLLKF
jgi:hypothetical protein